MSDLPAPSDAEAFRNTIERLESGDPAAAETLVREYESVVRRHVRFRLRDARLGRLVDSMDIYQSVMASFFIRAASGVFEIQSADDLVRLLTAMARRKLAATARAQYRQKRDVRRLHQKPVEDGDPVDPRPSPSGEASFRELLDRVHEHLSPDERQLAALRRDGLDWSEIARRLGGSPQARRMQLARAIERVIVSLELDEDR